MNPQHPQPTISKSLLLGLILTALAGTLCLAPRSIAKSGKPAATFKSPAGSDDEGKIVAQLKDYDPKTVGFGFANYGNDHSGWENDLTAADLIKLFGADKVCAEGDSPDKCVLTEPAEKWLEEELKGMNGGHCEGMAATTLRLWQGSEFKGKAHPGDFQQGAESVFDLKLDPTIANYIAYYFVTQTFDEVHSVVLETSKEKPSQLLETLISSFHEGKPVYTMGIYKLVNGERKDGHAITPYAVEEMTDSVSRVLVYDNNYPGETRYVEINKSAETWKYRTATKPGEPVDEYVGDAETHTLELTENSLRDPAGPFSCPFGEESNNSHARRGKTASNQVEISLEGEGEILITDGHGKRIGYDFEKNQMVNEIPRSTVKEFKGGLHKNVPPTYGLPHEESGKPYTIRVSGKGLKKEVDADLHMDGPGFVVGFEGILLDPGESLSMTISPNGRELSFTVSSDGETPNVFITTTTGHKGPSYLFEIGGLKLSAGKTVSMKLDLDKGKLLFSDNDTKRDAYDVQITRVNPNGTKNFYQHHDLKMAKKSDNYEMDFSKWDGKGEMCFKDDDEGNGFGDDPCTEESNDKAGKALGMNLFGASVVGDVQLRIGG